MLHLSPSLPTLWLLRAYACPPLGGCVQVGSLTLSRSVLARNTAGAPWDPALGSSSSRGAAEGAGGDPGKAGSEGKSYGGAIRAAASVLNIAGACVWWPGLAWFGHTKMRGGVCVVGGGWRCLSVGVWQTCC